MKRDDIMKWKVQILWALAGAVVLFVILSSGFARNWLLIPAGICLVALPVMEIVWIRCPSCGSRRWGYEYMSCMCKRCGYIGFVPNGGIGRCPSCRSTLSPCRPYDPVSDEGDPSRFTPDILDYLESLGPGDEAIGTTYLIDHGFDSEDASIVMSYISGTNEVSIAIEKDVSVQKVLSIVSDVRMSGLGRSIV